MASTLRVDSMLSRSPGICGGQLCIDGTRMTVNQIVTMYKRGESAEEIVIQYGQLSLAQIYNALAYYHAHQAEVDAELQEEEREAHQLERSMQRSSE